jgi:hypothetical protein
MKNVCPVSNELLTDYIYDEISDRTKLAEIEAHIKSCPECRAELKKLKMVKEAAKANEVDFSADVWAIHKQGILKKLSENDIFLQTAWERFRSIMNIKTLGLAVLILLMTGAGIQYCSVLKVSQEKKVIAKQMELLQNYEIIERLDFYEKISRYNAGV